MTIGRYTTNGIVLCPDKGQDGRGVYHTNLPLYYQHNLSVAAADEYYPLQYTDRPAEPCLETWELVDGVLVQVWTPYTPEPVPAPIDVEKLRADVDYIAMMTDVDLDGDSL